MTFYLYAFAALYLGMSVSDPSHFTEPLSHVGAFYFTVVVASTVGFGDITPNDDITRIIVTGQMLVNIALIGVGVRAILAIGRCARPMLHTSPSRRLEMPQKRQDLLRLLPNLLSRQSQSRHLRDVARQSMGAALHHVF